MRVLIQRVTQAEVKVAGEVVGKIDAGLLCLVGISATDTAADVGFMARKILQLRIFSDADGRMNHSVQEVQGAVCLVSQFTLCADVGKGTRPSFSRAMEPRQAKMLFDDLVHQVQQHVPVQTGRFGADMKVSLTNDGPVTLWLSTEQK